MAKRGGKVDSEGAVTTDKLAADAVENTKLADDAVQTENILDGTILTEDISDNAVATAKIADGAVTTTKLADFAVETSNIWTGAVTSAKLADNAVTAEKLDDSVAGEGLVRNSSTGALDVKGRIINIEQISKTINSSVTHTVSNNVWKDINPTGATNSIKYNRKSSTSTIIAHITGFFELNQSTDDDFVAQIVYAATNGSAINYIGLSIYSSNVADTQLGTPNINGDTFNFSHSISGIIPNNGNEITIYTRVRVNDTIGNVNLTTTLRFMNVLIMEIEL